MISSTMELQYQPLKSQYGKIMNPPPYQYYIDVEDANDDDENDDALSFCDLSIYSDATADWSTEHDQHSDSTLTTTSRSSSFSSTDMTGGGAAVVPTSLQRAGITDGRRDRYNSNDNDELFEFFSSELSGAAPASTPDNNILFCGRLLVDVNTSGGEPKPSGFSTDDQKFLKADLRRSKTRKSRLLHWIMPDKNSTAKTAKEGLEKQSSVDRAAGTPLVKKTTKSSSGVKLVTLSFSGLGIVRLPPSEIKMDEIKSRQGRRRSQRSYTELYEEEQRRRTNLKRKSSSRTPTRSTASGLVGMMRSFSSRFG